MPRVCADVEVGLFAQSLRTAACRLGDGATGPPFLLATAAERIETMFERMLVGYIDPMSGTILLQTLAAIAIGGVTFFRRWIWAAFSWVLRRKASSRHESGG